jgi:hypothetical protein
MDRGPGFYKLDETDLLCGPNYVLAGSFSLYKEEKDTYIYPMGGWYWFDTEAAARIFFGLPELTINTEEGNPYA